jgi:hypothetical protein
MSEEVTVLGELRWTLGHTHTPPLALVPVLYLGT